MPRTSAPVVGYSAPAANSAAPGDAANLTRKTLLENVPATLRAGSTVTEPPSPAEVSRMLDDGRKLQALGFPIDAIEVYLAALPRCSADSRSQIHAQLASAFGSLKSDSLARHFWELYERGDQFHLHLYIRQSNPAQGRMQSRWDPLLVNMVNEPETALQMKVALIHMTIKHPDSLPPLILAAQLAFLCGAPETAKNLATRLVGILEEPGAPKNPSPSPKPGNPANTDQLALWLVARECLAKPTLESMGEKLGQRALQASRIESDPEFTIAILTEWIQIAGTTGHPQTADKLKQELNQIKLP